MSSRTLLTACALAVAFALAARCRDTYAGATTRAQTLRAAMDPDHVRALRAELAKMRSPNRWPQAQQDRYLKVCMKAKKDEPSINRRVCECYLEVMMEKYATMGDFSKDLVNSGVQNDEKVAGLTGMCIAAFGD